ncbi:MAG TPA: hypothetical protein VIJ34_07875, partial [Acidimicrobiales bacterium]
GAASEIARLAVRPRPELVVERESLVALIGPGPAADLQWREDDARRQLGAALVSRDEAIDAEQFWRREAADRETFDQSDAREQLRSARRVRSETEREARNADVDASAVEQAILEQVRIRRQQGSDVRSALDRLELVDSALSTKRQSEIDQTSQSPPAYVVGLLGKQPHDRSRALRWRQGVVEIEDWRRSIVSPPTSESENPWQFALGPRLEGWEGRRRRRVIANLRAVRRDLGLELPDTPADEARPSSPTSEVARRIVARANRNPHRPGQAGRANPPLRRELP